VLCINGGLSEAIKPFDVARLHCRLGCRHEEETTRHGHRSRSSWRDHSDDVIGECAGPRFESWLVQASPQIQADADADANRHTDPDANTNPDINPDTNTNTNPDTNPNTNPNARWRVAKLLARLRHRDGERRIEFGHQ